MRRFVVVVVVSSSSWPLFLLKSCTVDFLLNIADFLLYSLVIPSALFSFFALVAMFVMVMVKSFVHPSTAVRIVTGPR